MRSRVLERPKSNPILRNPRERKDEGVAFAVGIDDGGRMDAAAIIAVAGLDSLNARLSGMWPPTAATRRGN